MIRNSNTNNIPQGLGQNDFLRLILTQLQHQNSKENHSNLYLENQSMNNEVRKMQESLQKMACSLQSNQALQASALVGRKVLVFSDHFYLGSNESVSLVVETLMEQVQVDIYAETGQLIKTFTLINSSQLEWDGLGQNKSRQAPGLYKIKAFDSKNKTLKTLVLANINSVKLGQNKEELKLNLAGIGVIALDQIRQISV